MPSRPAPRSPSCQLPWCWRCVGRRTEKQKVKLCSKEIRAFVLFFFLSFFHFFFFFFLQRNDFVFLEIIAAPKILVQTLPDSSLAYHMLC